MAQPGCTRDTAWQTDRRRATKRSSSPWWLPAFSLWLLGVDSFYHRRAKKNVMKGIYTTLKGEEALQDSTDAGGDLDTQRGEGTCCVQRGERPRTDGRSGKSPAQELRGHHSPGPDLTSPPLCVSWGPPCLPQCLPLQCGARAADDTISRRYGWEAPSLTGLGKQCVSEADFTASFPKTAFTTPPHRASLVNTASDPESKPPWPPPPPPFAPDLLAPGCHQRRPPNTQAHSSSPGSLHPSAFCLTCSSSPGDSLPSLSKTQI